VTSRAAEFRRDLEPFVCVRGPSEDGGGLCAVVRAGALDVTVTAHADVVEARAALPVAGLYVDARLSPLAELALHSSDPAYAAALVATTEARLARVIANGGEAQLRFGSWRVRGGAGATPRAVVEVVVALATRPARLAEAWQALAAALGATWRGSWGTRGETAFAVATTTGSVSVEVAARADADGVDRVDTAVVATDGRRRARPGVILDPTLLAAAIRELTGADLAIGAPRVAAVAPAAAPLAFADWPATRAPVAAAAAAPRGWRPGPPIGADARPGLHEQVVIDGVPVTTSCGDDPRATTAITAAAPGAAGLTLTARPGYRFWRGLFVPEPRLGDAAFDDRYVLDTDDLAWARWWFGAVEREAIAATFHAEAAAPLGFALADGTAAFTADAAPSRPYLDAARHAVAFLATRGARATAEWRQLAGPLDATVQGGAFTADGGVVLRTGRGAVAIEVCAGRHAGRLVTVARAGVAAPDEPRHLAIRADRVADPLPPTRGRADPTIAGPDDHTVRTSDPAWAAAHLAALGPALAAARPALIEIAGPRVVVRWAGPLFEPRRLSAGVDLIARVTRAGAITAAPYR
jgi:hypothetical protein